MLLGIVMPLLWNMRIKGYEERAYEEGLQMLFVGREASMHIKGCEEGFPSQWMWCVVVVACAMVVVVCIGVWSMCTVMVG